MLPKPDTLFDASLRIPDKITKHITADDDLTEYAQPFAHGENDAKGVIEGVSWYSECIF